MNYRGANSLRSFKIGSNILFNSVLDVPPINYLSTGGSGGLQGPQGFQGTGSGGGGSGFQGPTGPSGGPIGPQGNTGSIGLTGLQGVTGARGFQGVIGITGIQGSTGPSNPGVQGFQGFTGMQGLMGIQGATGPSNPGVQGYQGHTGLQGLMGIQGHTGLQGYQGYQGHTGLQGYQGLQGHTGFQGYQGYQGHTGLQGLQGYQGHTGLQGYQGYQGHTGMQGLQGHTGFQGLQGYQGHTGLQGYQGYQGHTGMQGYQGYQGYQGHTGLQGYQGHTGLQGYQGYQGYQGHTGLQGLQGIQGETGLQGYQGYQGHTGLQGYQGLAGNVGIQGATGPSNPGVQGLMGVTGAQGYQGLAGIQGSTGLQGYQGLAGTAGSAGVQGSTGSGFSTISNFGNYKILVSTGTSSNSAVAYNNLTYDGTILAAPNFTGSNIYASTQHLGNSSDSVSAPSFSWIGDTNCGLYHPTTDNIGIVTNGSERMRFDSAGNVGINTASPLGKLDVYNGNVFISGPVGSQPYLKFSSYSGANSKFPYLIFNKVAAWFTLYSLNRSGNDGICFGTSDGNGTNTSPMLSMLDSGRIGIGTESPSYQLELSTDNAAKLSTSTWTTTSDSRVKLNIQDADLDICYNTIKNLPLRRFTWDPYYYPDIKDRNSVGFIAQEVEQVFPKAITTTNKQFIPYTGTDGEMVSPSEIVDFKSLDVDQLNKTLFGTVKKCIQKIDTLEEQLATEKNKVNTLINLLKTISPSNEFTSSLDALLN